MLYLWFFLAPGPYFLYQLLYDSFSYWNVGVAIIFIFTYATDALSFSQSLVFLRMMRLSPRPIEFLLIAYADLCLSLSVAVLLLPFGFAAALYVYDAGTSITQHIALWNDTMPPSPFRMKPARGQAVVWSFAPSESYLAWRAPLVESLDGPGSLPFSWSWNYQASFQEDSFAPVNDEIARIENKFPNISFVEKEEAIDLGAALAKGGLPDKWVDFMTDTSSVGALRAMSAYPRFKRNIDEGRFPSTHVVHIGPYGKYLSFFRFYEYALGDTLGCLQDMAFSAFENYCTMSLAGFYDWLHRGADEANLSNITKDAYQPPVRGSLPMTTSLLSPFLTSAIIVLPVVVLLLTRVISLLIDIVLPARWTVLSKWLSIERWPFTLLAFAVACIVAGVHVVTRP
jgi:hypothetical protein